MLAMDPAFLAASQHAHGGVRVRHRHRPLEPANGTRRHDHPARHRAGHLRCGRPPGITTWGFTKDAASYLVGAVLILLEAVLNRRLQPGRWPQQASGESTPTTVGWLSRWRRTGT